MQSNLFPQDPQKFPDIPEKFVSALDDLPIETPQGIQMFQVRRAFRHVGVLAALYQLYKSCFTASYVRTYYFVCVLIPSQPEESLRTLMISSLPKGLASRLYPYHILERYLLVSICRLGYPVTYSYP